VPLDEDSFAYAFRSSGGLTYRLENDCENANTHAHGDVHLVMLAHLRRRWCFSGREGFGFLSLPPAKLARRDSTLLWKWNTYFPLRRMRRNGGERESLG
jgi:hypothetical protein